MRTKIKKYFIAYLSLVLILSNFSFATTLMLCKMGNMQTSCSCTQEHSSQAASLSKVNSCCENKTYELSNSNILSIVKNDLTGNFLSVIDVINTENFTAGLSSLNVSQINFELSYHPPNSEIPILNSSLLI